MTENEYEKIESWAESQDVEIWGHWSGNKLETLSVWGVKSLPSYFSILHCKKLKITIENSNSTQYKDILQIITKFESLETLEIDFYCEPWIECKKAVLSCDFSTLKNLKKLILNGSDVSKFSNDIINGIAKLRNLEYLEIKNHQIKSLPDEICKLEKLEILKLIKGDNYIKLPENIGGLKNLKILEIDSIESLPDSIYKLENLRELNVSVLKNESVPSEIANLRELNILKIAFLEECAFPIESVCKMTKLREIQISGGTFNALPPCIEKLKDLICLWLHNNRLERIPSEISNLSNLAILEICNNELRSLPDEIYKMTRLENLTLNDNKIDKISAQIGNLKDLIYLLLSGNKLDNLPKEIANLKELCVLFADRNNFNEYNLPQEILALKPTIVHWSMPT